MLRNALKREKFKNNELNLYEIKALRFAEEGSVEKKTSQAISEIDAETITRHHLWMNTGANSY